MKSRFILRLWSAILALTISLPVMAQIIFRSGFEDLLWQRLGADIDGEAAGDYSGWSVSLSADGNRVSNQTHLGRGRGPGGKIGNKRRGSLRCQTTCF